MNDAAADRATNNQSSLGVAVGRPEVLVVRERRILSLAFLSLSLSLARFDVSSFSVGLRGGGGKSCICVHVKAAAVERVRQA